MADGVWTLPPMAQGRPLAADSGSAPPLPMMQTAHSRDRSGTVGLASHRHKPLACSSRSEAICDFFERPSTIGQAGYGSAEGGGGDLFPELFLKRLAMLF